MDQLHHFPADHVRPVWREPEDARRELYERLEAFIRAAAAGDINDGEDFPALTLKVSAGVGKTSTALRLLARHGRALLARGHIMVYVPTLELAERAAADLQELDSDLPISIIRGRLASNPDSGKQMCERPDLVEAVTNLVPSVTQALCRVERGGELVEAPCASECPYLLQKDAVGAKIHFLSHSYLEAYPPVDRDTPVALRIIDEKVWPNFCSTTDIFVEEFLRAPEPGFPRELRSDLLIAKTGIVAALQNGADVRNHLMSHKVDKEKLKALSKGETASRDNLDIMPSDSVARVEFMLKKHDRFALFASRKRQALFDLLASKEALGPNRLTLEERPCGSGTRQVIRLYNVTKIERDAPLLMLDADADEAIAERLAPGTGFAKIETKPQAEIVQISDRTMSDTWLLDPEAGTGRRAKVLAIIGREVTRADGSGVLVVATKSVLEKLHEDAGQPVGYEKDEDMRRSLLGAMPRWFGPKMLGVNDYERYRTIVIIGRLQPCIRDIEKQARSLFNDTEAPLSQFTGGPLPEQETVRILHDGSLHAAKVRSHPDRRVEAVLRQTRECGTLQAIARLRLVSPDQPKRVVVLSSMPLLDLPISKLTTLDALFRDLEDEPDLAGYLRMERALRATMGRPVCGTRVSAAGLAADLSEDFTSVNAAKEFRRGRNTIAILDLIGRIAAKNQWPVTRIDLTQQGRGGCATPAVVFAPRSQALSQASRLWADFTARLVTP
ncbi:hypothetical protein [Actibacterium lipolyticum]|uniref:Helicase/UvrB N-terminal domain-containing protein n=1 Tax=Actibacterium lipolyticum TaxID=1524263 RepID=A0A238JZI1_9RHOB|nr:hypothetical protein [Actibacterium lipolyticum]SMX35272.1 hypothetical protein COL8621_01736 [Actibacterium lipolyticum]